MDHGEWLEELKAEAKAHDAWREKAKKVEGIYTTRDPSAYNILWANVQILQPALFSRTPKPDVQRRFKDGNLVAREAATVIERALEFSLDAYDFTGTIKPAVNNYLVAGLGQVRVNYVPYLSEVQTRVPVETIVDPETQAKSYLRGGEPVDGQEDEAGAFVMDSSEEIAYQEVSCSTVPWSQFRWSKAQDWPTVWWVGEIHYLTEDQMRDTFVIAPDVTVPLGFKTDAEEDGDASRCKVTEIWDKRERKHFGIADGMPMLLQFRAGDGPADDDPLGLSGFWPYPMPVMANTVAGDVCPVPDYLYYQEQALEMDTLTRRIQKLTAQLKWRGVHDGTFAELANLAAADDGTFLAVENMASRFPNGFDTVMAALPLEELQRVLAWLMSAREEVKQTIFEITGISDIVRGATKATETLGAQQLKSQYGSMRISDRQGDVEQFIREIFRIKAEIISEHFEPEVLSMMTGIEVTPEMQAIMKSDVLRGFNIDVESDSTVLADQQMEQDARTRVVQAVTELVSVWAPIIAQAPQLAELAKGLIIFQLGAFKHSRMIEDVVEQVFAQVGATPPPVPMGGPVEPNRDMAAPAIAAVA